MKPQFSVKECLSWKDQFNQIGETFLFSLLPEHKRKYIQKANSSSSNKVLVINNNPWLSM